MKLRNGLLGVSLILPTAAFAWETRVDGQMFLEELGCRLSKSVGEQF